MANTNILIKRSAVGGSAAPTSLLAGELAYSYNSNTAFIGSPTGNGVVKIGGQYYTNAIDTATSAATPDMLVKRDATGNASFNYITANIIGTIEGTANAALQLENSRNFSISGGDITASAVGFNGTADVTLNTSLNAVPGLSADTVGSSTSIPVITYGANGRILAVNSASISTSFNLYGDSGVTVVSGGDSLSLTGGEGITSVAGVGPNVTFDVDNTVVRANAFTGGTQTINTNLTIGANSNLTVTGNLIVTGNVISENVQQLAIQDPLIVLGIGNYVSDTKDIGFAAHYNNGSNAHTGLIRDADGDKEYYFFEGYTPDVDATNNIDITDASFRTANVHANYFKGNLIANTAVSDGFYGNAGAVLNLYPNQSYAASGDQYIIIDPTAPNHIHVRAGGTIDGSTAELFLGGENTGVQVSDTTDAVYINANSKTSTFNSNGTLTVFGKVIADGINLNDYTQAAFNKANASVTSTSTLTNGQLIIGAGSNNVTTLANTTYTLTGSLSAAKTITSLTVDAYGRVTAATGADIAIAASQVSGLATVATSGAYSDLSGTPTLAAIATSGSATDISTGTLSVLYGGTGVNTMTQYGVVYGGGTSPVGVTSAAGTADQTWSNQILTTTNGGVPVWTSALDGGTF